MKPRPMIALLHGWATDPEILDPIGQQYEQLGHAVSRYEMPGYGSRFSEAGAATLEELTDDAMDRLAGSEIWIGWSLGAMVALAAAARKPRPLSGVVGICATAKFCDDVEKENALRDLRQSVAENPAKAVKRFHRSMPSAENRRAMSKNTGNVDAVAVETLLSGLDMLARADLSEEVNKIDVPVCLISGTEDMIIPAASGEALHRMIPDSRFTALPCGHLPFVECPDLFTEQLFEFAQTIAESTASQKPI